MIIIDLANSFCIYISPKQSHLLLNDIINGIHSSNLLGGSFNWTLNLEFLLDLRQWIAGLTVLKWSCRNSLSNFYIFIRYSLWIAASVLGCAGIYTDRNKIYLFRSYFLCLSFTLVLMILAFALSIDVINHNQDILCIFCCWYFRSSSYLLLCWNRLRFILTWSHDGVGLLTG